MRNSIPCISAPCVSVSLASIHSAALPGVQLPGGPALNYGWLARRIHALCAWLLATYGQPTLGREEAFLAQSADHADCERRQRWLDRQHEQAWHRALAP